MIESEYPKIIRNMAQCGKCGDVIESKSVHDFRTCKCGAFSVDGGREYIRRIGDIDSSVEMSTYEE